MSLAAYNRSIGGEREPSNPVKPESQVLMRTAIQQQSDWLKAQRTQEVFKEIHSEIATLETEARVLAMQYPQHQNAYGIIQRLVRSNELRIVLDKYGKINTI